MSGITKVLHCIFEHLIHSKSRTHTEFLLLQRELSGKSPLSRNTIVGNSRLIVNVCVKKVS